MKFAMILVFTCVGNMLSAQTLDRAMLDSLIRRAEQTHSEAVIVYHDDKLVAEKYFGIGKRETKIEAMSATKSIVGLAAACLLSDGLIESLDIPVSAYYPEWRQGQKQLITIRHLLTHTSGIQNVPNTSVEIYPSPDFVQLALAAELSAKPGTTFSYNNKALNLMAGIIQKITRKRMDTYVGERLFKPLGITDFTWSLDESGNPHVMSGCQTRPADLAKVGLLLMNKGSYNGARVISEKAVQQVIQPSNLYPGYGLLWWISYDRVISVVDDGIIRELERNDIDREFVGKMNGLKGEYSSDAEFGGAMVTAFGPNAREVIAAKLSGKNVKLRNTKYEGPVIYRADGYLGNYIVVIPEKKIVAVRMISGESYRGDDDSFVDFQQHVTRLVR